MYPLRSNWNLELLILRREKNRRKTNKQLNSHEVPEPRIEPTTHWDHSGEKRAYYRNATHAIRP
jgi:hypothetical protein